MNVKFDNCLAQHSNNFINLFLVKSIIIVKDWYLRNYITEYVSRLGLLVFGKCSSNIASQTELDRLSVSVCILKQTLKFWHKLMQTTNI